MRYYYFVSFEWSGGDGMRSGWGNCEHMVTEPITKMKDLDKIVDELLLRPELRSHADKLVILNFQLLRQENE